MMITPAKRHVYGTSGDDDDDDNANKPPCLRHVW